jgi:hypothetical protein
MVRDLNYLSNQFEVQPPTLVVLHMEKI